GQSIEPPRLQTAWYNIVASSFRSSLYEHRRFDLVESVLIKIASHRDRRLVTQSNVVLHLLAPQVQVTIVESHLFASPIRIDLEGRSLGIVQDIELHCLHLNPARLEIWVGLILVAHQDFADDRNNVLVS